MRHLFTTIMLLGIGITQVAAQQLPETSVVVIGEVEGFKDGVREVPSQVSPGCNYLIYSVSV